MKGYSKAASHKGKTAYRTPSRWLAGRPEAFKRRQNTKLESRNLKFNNPRNPFSKSARLSEDGESRRV